MKYLTAVFGALATAIMVVIVVLVFLPTSWLADRLEILGSDFLDMPVSIGELKLDLIDLTPSAILNDVVVGDDADRDMLSAGQIEVSVYLKKLLTGSLMFEHVSLRNASVNLYVDSSGHANWRPSELADDKNATDPEATSPDEAALPKIETLRVDDSHIRYRNDMTSTDAALSFAASGSTIDPDQPTHVHAQGSVNNRDVDVTLETSPLFTLAATDQSWVLDLNAQIGKSKLSAKGNIGNPQQLQDLDINFSVSAPALEDFAAISGLPLPIVPPFNVEGDLRRDGNEIVFRRFDGGMGESDLQGDLRIDPTTQPPTLYANIISKELDLDDLAGFVGAKPDEQESPVLDSRVDSENQPPNQLLPDKPLNITALTRAARGAIQFRAQTVNSDVWPIDALDLRLELGDDRLSLSPATMQVAGGEVDVSMTLDITEDTPTGPVELRIKQINLRNIMRAIGVDNDSFGILGGRAKFWISGDSISDFLASADGGMFILMTGGKLDALLAELAGIDLVESLILLVDPEETRTDIRCGYIDIHSTNGVMDINKLVIDTDDTVFLADGQVDFNNETLDLILEPHPKDISLLAAQTAININGTLSQPQITPGSALAARAVIAATLASLATPAAALLPFIQAGSGEDSPYCDGLATTMNESR